MTNSVELDRVWVWRGSDDPNQINITVQDKRARRQDHQAVVTVPRYSAAYPVLKQLLDNAISSSRPQAPTTPARKP